MSLNSDAVTRIQQEWALARPDVDVSPQGVIGRLHRLAGHLTAELTAVYGRHGLSEGDFDVLATLRRSGPRCELAAGQLAAHTMLTTGGTTKRIDRLEKAGLVRRTRANADGRGRMVTLTVEGRDAIDRAFTEHMHNERRLLSTLDPDDVAALERILASWLSQFEQPGQTARQ